MKRILVTGGTGFIGSHLVKSFQKRGYIVSHTTNKTDPISPQPSYYSVDITDEREVRFAINDFNPDVTIHTAALSDADRCEDSPQTARKINVHGTRNIIKACEYANSKIVFFSSSFVFNGREGPYSEDEMRNPINYYGETKVHAEDLVRSSPSNHLIIRTDQPFGWPLRFQERTMVTWLLKQLSRHEKVKVFEDWYNTPIYIPDLAELLWKLLQLKADGVYNIVGSEFISRHKWALMIAQQFNIDSARIVPSSSDHAGLSAPRPNANLKNDKIIDKTGYLPRSLSSSLQEMSTAVVS